MHVQTSFIPTRTGAPDPPRLAVVVMPAGGRSPDLRPWLRTRFGIGQVHAVTLADVEWDGLAAAAANPHADDRLRGRLAVCLLSRPELIVVLGHPDLDAARGTRPRGKRDVERIVQRIRAWRTPTPVIGAWTDGPGDAAAAGARPDISVLGGGDASAQWLAESAWENEGGRIRPARDLIGASDGAGTGRVVRRAGPGRREDDGSRTAGRRRSARPAPAASFLDFDPVLPGWPPAEAGAAYGDARRRSRAEVGASS